jgi:hypothetical protein
MHLRHSSQDRIYPGLSIELPLPFPLSPCRTGQSTFLRTPYTLRANLVSGDRDEPPLPTWSLLELA